VKLPVYPTYRATGVEWLGDVPDHWGVKRLKCAATYWVSNVDKVPADDETPVRLCNYTDVYYHDHIRPSMGLMETTASLDEIRRFGLVVGDVVITKDSEEWSDIAVPALVVESSPDLVCGYHLAIVRPNESRLIGTFLLRLFQACAVNQQFQVAATGVTRYGLPKSAIGEALIPLPPREEQRSISDFLDRETAKIDALVAKKRTLIERLKEKRTALISRTVTRGLPPAAARAAGLDPNPKLKPSGIDWLGEVPAHWTPKRLRFISPHITVGIVVEPSKYYEDEGVPCLRSLNVRPNELLDRDIVFISPESHRILAKSMVRKGDLVAVRSGQPGTTAVVDDRFDEANCIDLIIIRRPRRGDPTFFSYFLNSLPAQAQFSGGSGGAIQQHFNITMASDLWLVEPPPDEQRAIAVFLDRELAKLDSMVSRVNTAIERLQEYRTAIITASVTGKVDVRGATA
jgi:type I restriction enzyme S subunit